MSKAKASDVLDSTTTPGKPAPESPTRQATAKDMTPPDCSHLQYDNRTAYNTVILTKWAEDLKEKGFLVKSK